jgi:hypothetical protein
VAEAVALDLKDAAEPEGETTEEREGVLASAGEGLEDMEDVKDDNKVPLDAWNDVSSLSIGFIATDDFTVDSTTTRTGSVCECLVHHK